MTDPKFLHWKKEVDIWINILAGMSSDDLPDWDYYRAYLARQSPRVTAQKAIRAVKDF